MELLQTAHSYKLLQMEQPVRLQISHVDVVRLRKKLLSTLHSEQFWGDEQRTHSVKLQKMQ